MTALLETRGLTKRFGPQTALDRVDLAVRAGEVHAVLGENGAGKTTLMNLLFGLLRPDEGEVRLEGRAVSLSSPRQALERGIGMVHQHFMLVDRLTVWENVWLTHPDRPAFRLRPGRARAATAALSDRFRLRFDPDARVEALPVGMRQRVEIAKALSRRCSVLILDEPTAVLAPPEIDGLFEVIRELSAAGTSVLLISHKLDEVLDVSDRITVLRRGKVVQRCDTADAERGALTRAIIGAGEAPSVRPGASSSPGEVLLSVRGLRSAAGRIPVRDVSFELRAGEILGVTGVDGNGQEELVALLAGLVAPSGGAIELRGEDVSALGVAERWRRGLSVLPGDRGREGLLLDASLWENLALREFGAPWARTGPGGLVDPGAHRRRAAELLARHDIRASGADAPASSLSGGNQQKLLLARELAADPSVLVLLNPTRGLDVGAAGALLANLAELRARGRGILLFSTELEEVAATGDRWAVLRGGGWHEADRPDPQVLGSLMLGSGAA